MAGGTHHRNSKRAFEKHKQTVGQKKLCGCPIHKKNGLKTEVDLSIFNIAVDSKDGYQSMCKIGKTLLDSFKHKMNAFKLVYIFDKLTNSQNIETIRKNFKNKNSQKFFDNIISIFDNTYNDIETNVNSTLFFEFMSQIDSIIGDKSESLLKRINIYDSNLSEKDFKEIISDFDPSFSIVKEDIKLVLKLQDMFCDERNLYVKESADGILHEHSNFRTNLTKVRGVYNEDGSKFMSSKGIQVRINKWNTLVTGKSDSRVERYFPDGDYKLANSKMRNINKDGLSADHIWPISLGGKHDESNLESMPLLENIKKRNNLNINLINRVLEDPSKYISDRYIPIFMDICICGKITQETVFELERRLKYEIDEWVINIKKMNHPDKKTLITEMLINHNINHSKVESIIADYF